MFGKKIVSDALLATVKEVTSGEQIDSTGNRLLVGDGVTVQEGPHAGRTGTISGFQNTGRSEVQLDRGPSVAIYNEVLLNEGKKKTDDIDPEELKKKFKDREDQDIDNDGDEDESDRFLHKRRKAIAKSKKKKNGNGNGNGEKIEINPEIKEAIRKLIHSTLK